jgi:RHH-type proline utilization regulon transcriptional repressor/proline dehydrogenase/delta 1-pyrroline-5-carboxylate dehydrogenase
MVTPGASTRRDEFLVGPERLLAIDAIAPPEQLAGLRGLGAVALWADDETLRRYRIILSARDGPIIPLLAESDIAYGFWVERQICIDTTAARGNASLLAGADENDILPS